MGFDATYIPAIMLIVVGVGWMLVWAFGGGERGSETSLARLYEQCYEGASTSTHAGTLERYSRDTDAKIRRLVGQNPSTPRETH